MRHGAPVRGQFSELSPAMAYMLDGWLLGVRRAREAVDEFATMDFGRHRSAEQWCEARR